MARRLHRLALHRPGPGAGGRAGGGDRDRAAQRPGLVGGRQPGQERIPLPAEPRAAHPAHRHDRLRRPPPHRASRPPAGAPRPHHPQGGRPSPGPGQRHPRHLPDRGGPALPLPGAGGGAAPGRGGARPHPPHGRRAGDHGPGRGHPGGADRRRRPPAAQAGAAQLRLQRHQVQPAWRLGGDHRGDRRRQLPNRRPGQRARAAAGGDGAALRALRAALGSHLGCGGHRAGARPLQVTDGGDGRPDRGGEPGRQGLHLLGRAAAQVRWRQGAGRRRC